MTLPPLTDCAEAVTPEWLTDVLRASGALEQARVRRFESREVGTGQMGASVRFTLEYDGSEDGAPASVVGKFPSADPTSRATGVAQGSYLKEVRFYQALQASVGIRTPHCHYAGIDPASGAFALVLEDLAPARQGDQITGCSVDQAAVALDELAKLHAPRWRDTSLLDLDWIARPSPENSQLLQAVYQAVFPGFVERYEKALAQEQIALADRLGRNLAKWATPASDAPFAVVHGDYRVDNMLFATPEGGHPLTVVDWQTCGVGPPVADAAYFLGASLLPQERRKHEGDLLRAYHDALLRAGVDGYDFEHCWRDYVHYTFSGVVMAVVASMIVQRHERGDEMFIAMATRHATHALDLGADGALTLP